MNKKYLFIDTNNFIEPMEDGFKQIQINLDDFKELKKLLEGNKLNLLLPESVILESKRLVLEKNKELMDSFKQIQSNFKINSENIKQKTDNFFKELLEEEKTKLKEIEAMLNYIFSSSNKNVYRIELNDKIYLQAYRRTLLGLKPFNKEKQKTIGGVVVHSVSPDVISEESLKYFFEKNGIKDYKLIICSRDPDWKENAGSELDPQVRSDFRESKLYITLRECLRTEYAVDLPLVEIQKREEKIELEGDKQLKPPVPIELLIDELEKSGSFDSARKNMSNLLNMKKYLTTTHLRKILKAMFSNPYNYTINQVMAVDVGEEFTKKMYLSFKDEEEIWKEFADDLLLFYGDKTQYLEDYDWLFDRLGVSYKKKGDEIPF